MSCVAVDPLRRWATQIANKRSELPPSLARKLAGVLWAMWRDGTVYDACFAARESSRGLKRDAQNREVLVAAMTRAAKKLQRREQKTTKAAKALSTARRKVSKEASM